MLSFYTHSAYADLGFLTLCMSFFAPQGEKTTYMKKESTMLPQATTAFV